MSFICLRIVDLPDSPAPGMVLALAADPSRPAMLTKKKHLDLVPLRQLIALQLILDLLIPLFPLLLLCTHPTTHLGGC